MSASSPSSRLSAMSEPAREAQCQSVSLSVSRRTKGGRTRADMRLEKVDGEQVGEVDVADELTLARASRQGCLDCLY